MKIVYILILLILSSTLFGRDLAPINAFVVIGSSSKKLDASFFGHSAYMFEFSDGSQKLFGYTPELHEEGISDFLKTLGIGKSLPVIVHSSSYNSYYDQVVIRENRKLQLLKVKNEFVPELYQYVNQQYYGVIPTGESYSLTSNNCASILCDTLNNISKMKDSKLCNSLSAHLPSSLGSHLKDIGFVLDEVNIGSGSDQRKSILMKINDKCLSKNMRSNIASKSSVKRHAGLVLLSYKNRSNKCDDSNSIDQTIEKLLKVEINSVKRLFKPSDYMISATSKESLEANKRTEVLSAELVKGKINVRLRVKNYPYQRIKKNKGMYSYRTDTIDLEDFKSFNPENEYTVSVEFNSHNDIDFYIFTTSNK